MGIGPVPAIQNVLKVAGLTLNDIDLVEVRIQISQFRLPRQAYISKSILFVFHRLTKHSVCKHWLVQNRLVWIWANWMWMVEQLLLVIHWLPVVHELLVIWCMNWSKQPKKVKKDQNNHVISFVFISDAKGLNELLVPHALVVVKELLSSSKQSKIRNFILPLGDLSLRWIFRLNRY